MDMEVAPSCRFRAIDSSPHSCHIQLHLQNPFFAPDFFDKYGEIGFYPFPQPGLCAPGKAILGCLLTDRTAAANWASIEKMGVFHLRNFLEVKSIVLVKSLIFRCNDGIYHFVGNIINWRPFEFDRHTVLTEGMKRACKH